MSHTKSEESYRIMPVIRHKIEAFCEEIGNALKNSSLSTMIMAGCKLTYNKVHFGTVDHPIFTAFTLKNNKRHEVKRDLTLIKEVALSDSQGSKHILFRVCSFNDLEKSKSVAWKSFLSSQKENRISSRSNTPRANRAPLQPTPLGNRISSRSNTPRINRAPLQSIPAVRSMKELDNYVSDNESQTQRRSLKRLRRTTSQPLTEEEEENENEDNAPTSPFHQTYNNISYNMETPEERISTINEDDDDISVSSSHVKKNLEFHYLNKDASPGKNWSTVQKTLSKVVLTMYEEMQKVDELAAEVIELCRVYHPEKNNDQIMFNMIKYLMDMGKECVAVTFVNIRCVY